MYRQGLTPQLAAGGVDVDAAALSDVAVDASPAKASGEGIGGPHRTSVSTRETKHLRIHTEATGAESGSVGARSGAKQDSNTTLGEWLDWCPMSLSDDQRTKVMAIITDAEASK